MTTFASLGVDPALTDALGKKGITEPFAIQDHRLPITVSQGISATHTGEDHADQMLIQRADLSMYVAKSDGRDCVRTERDLPM